MPTAATTAPSAGTAAHDHDDAHIRAQRAAWYVALRSGLDARGSLPPVEPWAREDGREMPLGFARPALRSGMAAWDEFAGEWWVAYAPCLVREVDRDLPHVAHDVERVPRPPRAAPTTGSQWCGVLHHDAPDDAVVRWMGTWLYFNGNRVHVTDATNGNILRSASPATPASIPNAREDGRVEWRDDPDLLALLKADAADKVEAKAFRHGWPTHIVACLAEMIDARCTVGLVRARLLGGTSAGDPPSPWWEGDGRGPDAE